MQEMSTSTAGQPVTHYRHSKDVLVPRLRDIRLDRGLSQEDLAEKAGVGRATISRGENGGDIRISSARKLAVALRVRVADLRRER
jgi:transcriptional regulator with XRE-family HTH domain